MDVTIAYIVTELTDPHSPAKFPGAKQFELERIARRILDSPENRWQHDLAQSAHRCAALAMSPATG